MVPLNSFDLPKFPVVLQPWTIVFHFDNIDNLHLITERPTIYQIITIRINNLTHSVSNNQTDIFLDPNFFILVVLRQDSGMVAVGQKPQKPRRATPKEGHFQNWPLQRRRRRRSRKYLLSGETSALSAKSARSSLMVSTARERGLPSENICIWPDTFAQFIMDDGWVGPRPHGPIFLHPWCYLFKTNLFLLGSRSPTPGIETSTDQKGGRRWEAGRGYRISDLVAGQLAGVEDDLDRCTGLTGIMQFLRTSPESHF